MSEYAVGLFEEAGLALFKGDYEAADEVVEQAKEAAGMQEDLLNLIEKTKETSPTRSCPSSSRTSGGQPNMPADIAEVVINMNTEGTMTKPRKGPDEGGLRPPYRI